MGYIYIVSLSALLTQFQVQRLTDVWYWAEYATFSISDEADFYRLSVAEYSGDNNNNNNNNCYYYYYYYYYYNCSGTAETPVMP